MHSVQQACTGTMSILDRVHAAFFNYHQSNEMTHMPDEIVLARIMTTLDLKFEKALHYHDKGYESDNAYGLPAQVMRLYMFIQSHRLQGSTMFHLSLHVKVTQGLIAFPSRRLPMPNFWWDTPTRSRLWQWVISPYSWPWWPSMTQGACAYTFYPFSPISIPFIPLLIASMNFTKSSWSLWKLVIRCSAILAIW